MGGKIEMVYAGNAVYLHWPNLLREQPGLKPWLRENVSQAQSGSGGSSTGFADPSFGSPRVFVFVAGLADGADTVRSLGEGRVRGRPTTHYVLRVTPSKFGLADGHDLPEEVWVDRNGRLTRMLLDFGPIRTPSGKKPTFELEAEFYAFNRPVQVKLPPRSQIGDFSSVHS